MTWTPRTEPAPTVWTPREVIGGAFLMLETGGNLLAEDGADLLLE